jgi:predicted dinucleotide-binding enzyme
VRIGIIGAGRVGATLGSQWARAGHHVVFGSRDPSAAGVMAAVAGAPGSTAALVEEAAEAEVVVVTVPGPALPSLAAVADRLAGKVVVNASNVMGDGPSATALLAVAAPGARQVRAFNTVGVENMAEPTIDGTPIDLLWAGEEDTVAVAEQLIGDVGFRPVRVGGLDRSDLVDAVFRLWIALAVSGGRGRRLGFQVLTPTPH